MKKILMALFVLGFCFSPVFANEELPILNAQEKEILQTELQNDVFSEDKIINYKAYKISSIDKQKIKNKKDALIIYTPLFGKSTNSDLKGFEAVIVNNRVVKLNQSNSYIPNNGYVVSGHGKAKKFITQNFFEGADVKIDFDKSEFIIAIQQDNYVYEANYRINKALNLLKTKETDSIVASNMNFYINKAQEILYRAKKLVEFEDYENAKKMADDSMIYSDMALFSSMPYILDEFRGIYVFPYQKSEEEIKQAFNVIASLNIDYIFIDAYFNGTTIYNSDVQKEYNLPEQNRSYKGFDPLQAWIDIAEQNDKKVIANFSLFDMGNPPKSTIKTNIVKIHKDWLLKTNKKNSYYLNPENDNVQTYILKLIAEVQNKYNVAGINLKNINIDNKYDTITVINKIINLQQDKITALEIASDMKSTDKIITNENVILLPLLKSPDENFTKDFLVEIIKYTNNAKVYPVYFEPYNEDKPRVLFDKINVSRNLGLKGVIIYDLDCLDKRYYDAIRLSIFQPQLIHKQKNLFVKDNTIEKEESNRKEEK